MENLKVVVFYRDGTTETVEISRTIAVTLMGPSDAIKLAKQHIGAKEKNAIKYEVQEPMEFI